MRVELRVWLGVLEGRGARRLIITRLLRRAVHLRRRDASIAWGEEREGEGEAETEGEGEGGKGEARGGGAGGEGGKGGGEGDDGTSGGGGDGDLSVIERVSPRDLWRELRAELPRGTWAGCAGAI